jgi:predicted O-methyltransferase YrrM
VKTASDALTWLPAEEGGPGWFRRVERFRVGDVEFRCSFERGSRLDRFYIRKHRQQVESYLSVLDRFAGANLVELGIMEGGSTALAALAAAPRKLVALELDAERVRALDELIEREELGESVRPYYGVDQSDRQRVGAIMAEEFGDERIDLVIDDASHRLAPTRASFETLFPRLREGGLFLIEDWRWQIRRSAVIAKRLADPESPGRERIERRLRRSARSGNGEGGDANRAEPPLPALVVELMLAKGESDEFVSEVAIGPWWVAVERGAGELDPASFRVADLYTDRMGLLAPGGRSG